MSRRDDRDRGERSSRAQTSNTARTNEYFVPKDGIDREVITADICRYLGNDALVRPGNYDNPQTRQVQAGYFITAYRNLTTAMIADLKADSERWEAERRANSSRGQAPNGEYRTSRTHESRQYYGPTEASATPSQAYPGSGAYGSAAVSSQSQVYENSPQYAGSSYSQPVAGYAAAPTQAYPADTYYSVGTNLEVDGSQRSDRPVQQTGAIPRSGTAPYSSGPSYQQSETRYYSTQPAASPVSAVGYQQQPSDPFYGRAAPAAGIQDYSTQESSYGSSRYPEQSYSQAPISSSSAATSGSSRRDRDRDSDRDSRHHRSRR